MKICCWDCEFYEYDEAWDGETEIRFYMCKHPKGDGFCDLPKYCGEVGDCPLLDSTPDRETAGNG